jgi:hypothetical protein
LVNEVRPFADFEARPSVTVEGAEVKGVTARRVKFPETKFAMFESKHFSFFSFPDLTFSLRALSLNCDNFRFNPSDKNSR